MPVEEPIRGGTIREVAEKSQFAALKKKLQGLPPDDREREVAKLVNSDTVAQTADFSDPATDFAPLLDQVIREARLHGVAAWLERHGAKLFADGSIPTIAWVDHADAQHARISNAKTRALDHLREVVRKHAERMTKMRQEALKNEVAVGVRHAEEFAKLLEARALVHGHLSSSRRAIDGLDKRLSMALRTIDRMRANAAKKRRKPR